MLRYTVTIKSNAKLIDLLGKAFGELAADVPTGMEIGIAVKHGWFSSQITLVFVGNDVQIAAAKRAIRKIVAKLMGA